MDKDESCCRYERTYAVQFENLRERLDDVKERVGRLESLVIRGVFLLVANLVGVAVTLAERLIRI